MFWWWALILISLGSTKSKDLKCENLNISLTQKIDGEGFHREIKWLLEQNSTLNCRLAIKLEVGSEMFVNPDQINDLNRLGHLSVLVGGDVDIEAAAHLATEHIIYLFAPQFIDKILFSVPFHLRYQRAQIGGGFGKVPLNKPSVLAICPDKCSTSRISAPCNLRNESFCDWHNVTYQALFEEMELLVPVGNLDDYPLVSIVTLLLGCAGCIYTLSVLSTTPL